MAATRGGRTRPGIGPLVAAGVGALAAGTARAETSLDFKLLFYGEANGRTQVWNPELYLSHDFGPKGQVGLLLAYDSISGASPTGEFPTLDATASASSAGQIPMAQYKDTRRAASLSYAKRFGDHLPSVDLSYSREGDYDSQGISLADSWNLFGERSTLHVGIGGTRDGIDPVNLTQHFTKRSDSFSAGWTQILDPRNLLDVSLSLTQLDGYLTDPYKLVPIGLTTAPEVRPDSRSRRTIVFKYGHAYESRGALKLNYRFYTDDWSVRAHTVELVHDQRVGRRLIVTPRLRFYTQGAASFFAYEFAAPQTYMSSDYRLSAFSSWLGGLGISYELHPGFSVNLAASYLEQTGRDSVLPRGSVPVLTPPAPLEDGDDDGEGGPHTVSSADLSTVTATVGFSYRF